MSGYTYDQIFDNQRKLYEACINNTMKILNFHGDIHSGWIGWDNAGTRQLKISPPGGAYEGSTFVSGGQVTDAITGEPAIWEMRPEGFPFHDFASMVSYYSDTINQMFSDWTFLPDPDNFGTATESGRAASAAIALVPVGGSSVGEKGGETPPWTLEGFGSNDAMLNYSYIETKIGQFDGDAMNTFNRDYVSKLGSLATAQQYMTRLLWSEAAGQKQMWLSAQQVVADIAGKGAAAAEAAQGPQGTPLSLDLVVKVVGSALMVAALVAGEVATEGAATPFLVGAASTVAGIVGKFTKPSEGDTGPKGLGASTPVGVLANMSEAFEELRKQIAAEERGQRDALTQAKAFVDQYRSSFDFAAPDLDSTTDPGAVRKSDEIGMNTDTLRHIATNELPAIADQFKTSASSLSQDGGSGPWTRPGSIGIGATGPFPQWQALATEMTSILDNTYAELYRAAEKLEVVANDFDKTDGQIQADLEAKNKQIEKVPS